MDLIDPRFVAFEVMIVGWLVVYGLPGQLSRAQPDGRLGARGAGAPLASGLLHTTSMASPS
jgi:hypothetical protein